MKYLGYFFQTDVTDNGILNGLFQLFLNISCSVKYSEVAKKICGKPECFGTRYSYSSADNIKFAGLRA